jgi:AcrR family transcriptional regulator
MAERADAVRNREAILAAALRLIGEHGLDAICMEDVAAAAGVGKGTVFRRFGDREGLVSAVVARCARDWQAEADALLTADDRPAAERVVVFVGRLFDFVVESLPLVRALEQVTQGQECCDANFDLTLRRLAALIAQARPGCDADYFAHALLANLRGEVIHLMVQRCGMSPNQVREGVIALARSVLGRDLVAGDRDATMPAL